LKQTDQNNANKTYCFLEQRGRLLMTLRLSQHTNTELATVTAVTIEPLSETMEPHGPLCCE
jgi:hypothetical protein